MEWAYKMQFTNEKILTQNFQIYNKYKHVAPKIKFGVKTFLEMFL
jgi:hypothetical protein